LKDVKDAAPLARLLEDRGFDDISIPGVAPRPLRSWQR
jgi:hypothetical protein